MFEIHSALWCFSWHQVHTFLLDLPKEQSISCMPWKWAVQTLGLGHFAPKMNLCVNVPLKSIHSLIFERNCNWLSGSKFTGKVLVLNCMWLFGKSPQLVEISCWAAGLWPLDFPALKILMKMWNSGDYSTATHGCCFTFSFPELKWLPKNWIASWKVYCFVSDKCSHLSATWPFQHRDKLRNS